MRPRAVDGDGAAHCDDVHEGERRRGRLEGGKDHRSGGAPAVLVRRRLPRAGVYPRGDLFGVRAALALGDIARWKHNIIKYSSNEGLQVSHMSCLLSLESSASIILAYYPVRVPTWFELSMKSVRPFRINCIAQPVGSPSEVRW